MAKTQSLTAKFIKDEAACRIKWEVGGREAYSLSTDFENFFSQPAIIREEALFQGINRLGLSAKIKRKNIRRTNVRHFAERKVTAVDLGPLQIRQDSRWVMILAAKENGEWGVGSGEWASRFSIPFHSEKGFSLLINAPGSFNLKGIVLEASAFSIESGCCSNEAFLALLPLVVRPRLRGDRIGRFIATPEVVVAADSLGPAAFIGSSSCPGSNNYRLLQRRDDAVALRAALPVTLVQVTIKVRTGV
jgi:hypothetical protein